MVKIAQIGIGNWGKNLLRNFFNLQDCQVRLCCDHNKTTLDKVIQQYNGKVRVTQDPEEVFNDPQIDAVIIATPAVTHAKFSIWALSCGKHVFVEKPLALNVQDGQAVIKSAKENKRILMVGHLLLYHPAIQKLKSYVEDGTLGQIHYIYSTRVNLGQVREEESALWSLTAHDISVAIYLLNQEPLEVCATGKSYIRESIQDVVFVTINFEGNIMAHIHASWLDPHKIRKFTVVGSKKMAVFDDMESAEKIRLYDKGFSWQKAEFGTYDTFLTLREGDIYIPKLDMVEPLRLECQHFLDCILNGKEPQTGPDDGLAVLKVLAAAQRSLEEGGRPVKTNN
jgi:predicted dehydrogenase